MRIAREKSDLYPLNAVRYALFFADYKGIARRLRGEILRYFLGWTEQSSVDFLERVAYITNYDLLIISLWSIMIMGS